MGKTKQGNKVKRGKRKGKVFTENVMDRLLRPMNSTNVSRKLKFHNILRLSRQIVPKYCRIGHDGNLKLKQKTFKNKTIVKPSEIVKNKLTMKSIVPILNEGYADAIHLDTYMNLIKKRNNSTRKLPNVEVMETAILERIFCSSTLAKGVPVLSFNEPNFERIKKEVETLVEKQVQAYGRGSKNIYCPGPREKTNALMHIGAISENNHWRGFSIIWESKTIIIIDSLSFQSSKVLASNLICYVKALHSVVTERARYPGFGRKKWKVEFLEVRKQQDGESCGFHTAIHLERLARLGCQTDDAPKMQNFSDRFVRSKFMNDFTSNGIVSRMQNI